MELNKLTAVEWFLKELENMQYFIGNDMLEAFKEAKELEKQQIIEAYVKGTDDGINDGGEDAEQYYNETFNK